MSARLRALSHLFQARLSQRIVLWVFFSIVAIEAIILIPSVYRRQRELLAHLREISAAKVSAIHDLSAPQTSDREFLQQIARIQQSSLIRGGVLYYPDGERIGTFGELPELTFDQVRETGNTDRLTQNGTRYDAALSMPELSDDYLLIVRHDASGVRQELYAFIGRIAGLVVIISVFVTVATMTILEPTLISPILWLRSDLLKAGEATRRDREPPPLASAAIHRQDELGEVIAAFHQMFQQVQDAIAERKQAEAALRLSEEKFSKAFWASPDPVGITTLADGRFIEVNDSFLKTFGYEREEVINRTAIDLELWFDPQERAEIIQLLHSGGSFRNQERRFRTKSGELKTILFSAERIDLSGRECLLFVANDITERKQVEEALRESEERFRTLVENAVDAFLVVDSDGKFVDANQRACASLGYSREELLTLHARDVQKKLNSKELLQIRRQVDRGEPLTVEGMHQRKDGTTFPVEVGIGQFFVKGERFHLAVARDITERKQAEKALARLAEIGELAAMIVHEVRNPLTTVLMGLTSFQRMDLPERAKIRLSLALDEAERLKRLLNEILLYSRPQSLQKQELELNTFITQILEELRSMPAASGRRIEFTPAAIPVRVSVDPDKLKQVFINLVGNACEAIAPGEVVTWQVKPELAHRQVCIPIHNGGDPIPPDVLPNLTKPFFTTKSSGNGLGLAIVKRIVEAHEGELGIESTAEMGTTVSVRLPLASERN